MTHTEPSDTVPTVADWHQNREGVVFSMWRYTTRKAHQ